MKFTSAEIAGIDPPHGTEYASNSVEITRRERFDYGFKAPAHLLIAAERAERDDGETLVEGLPRSTLRSYSGRLSFIPAGHMFYGWQDPRVLTPRTYFYIDPHDRAARCRARICRNRIQAAAVLLRSRSVGDRAQAQGPAGSGERAYVNALSIVLAHELMRLNDGPVQAEPVARGGLAGWQQKRVAEYIEAHVADDIRWRSSPSWHG